MNEADLKLRTKTFALRVLKLVGALPDSRSGRVLANQQSRSRVSVGANYRAACRLRSAAEMISKLAVVEAEADELTAIMVASRRTLGLRGRKPGFENRKSS